MKKYISLGVKCPHCGESLMDNNHPIHGYPSIRLKIQTDRASGTIWLCSIYDNYDHENDIDLQEDEIVTFYCPFCHHNLMLDNLCTQCKARMVGLDIIAGGKIDFCSRKGCRHHYVLFENLIDEIRSFYIEYGTPE